MHVLNNLSISHPLTHSSNFFHPDHYHLLNAL
jgi:hypothetical protein